MPLEIPPGQLAAELQNFQEIAEVLKPSPGNVPRVAGVEICGMSKALEGSVGGDHIVYIDFNERYDLEARIAKAEAESRPEVAAKLRQCRGRAGILIADASGHRVTDAVITAMLHQAFLLGVYYELDRFGEVTTKLFEHLNQRFFRTTSVSKYLTMLYGEISERGRFRFISAAHPPPMLYSHRTRRLTEAGGDSIASFPPVGMFASRGALDERVEPGWLGYKDPYTVNQIELVEDGDLLLLATDGLVEHLDGAFFPAAVEELFQREAEAGADEICQKLWQEVVAAGPRSDDVSLVVIKKTPA